MLFSLMVISLPDEEAEIEEKQTCVMSNLFFYVISWSQLHMYVVMILMFVH